MFFAADGALLGLISVADPVKETSAAAIAALHKQGLRVVLLTGRQPRRRRAHRRPCGRGRGNPGGAAGGKSGPRAKLEAAGRKVMMVGDGINDAPALTAATVGCAIGSGSDIAIEAADIVLMRSDLEDVPRALRLSALTLRDIKQNLFWAFCYNTIGIPIAAGLLYALGGPLLSPYVRGSRYVPELRVRGGQRPAFGHREAVKRRKQWQRKRKTAAVPSGGRSGSGRRRKPCCSGSAALRGQVRGVRGMVENSAYCTDILTQVSAIQSALNAFNRELLARHIRTCVVTDIQKGDLDVVDDLVATIQKMMK